VSKGYLRSHEPGVLLKFRLLRLFLDHQEAVPAVLLAFPATSSKISLESVADSPKITNASPESWENQNYSGANLRLMILFGEALE
jgi:hypothetical protein